MKKNRPAPKEPPVRLNPSYQQGLTKEEAAKRKEDGFYNAPPTNTEKSDLRIIAENAFSLFNVILYIIAIVMVVFMIYLRASGHADIEAKYFGVTKFLFLFAALGNVIIGCIQGLKAKRVLRKLRLLTVKEVAIVRDGEKGKYPVEEIVLDDVILLSAGEQIMVDATVIHGEMWVDESMLTGESRLVRKVEGDKLFSGSLVNVGSCYAKVEEVGEETYVSKMNAKVKSLTGHKSELMVGVYRILNSMAILLLVIVVVVVSTLTYKISVHPDLMEDPDGLASVANWARLFVTTSGFAIGVIPTGLALLTSIALAVSIIKLARQNTLIQGMFSLENLSRADLICLDKTGTLTDGTMQVIEHHAFCGEDEFNKSLSLFLGAFESGNATSDALADFFTPDHSVKVVEVFPFSSATKKSGYRDENGDVYWLGAPDVLVKDNAKAIEYAKFQASQANRVVAFVKNCVAIA